MLIVALRRYKLYRLWTYKCAITRTSSVSFVTIASILSFMSQPAYAARLNVNAGVESRVGVYDAVQKKPIEKSESDFVADINPNIGLSTSARRFNLKLDYRLENRTFFDHPEYNDTNHIYALDSKLELVKNSFDIAAQATRSQFLLTSNGAFSTDNLSISEKRNKTKTKVTPTLKLRYLDIAEGNVSYDVGKVSTEGVTSDSTLTRLVGEFKSSKKGAWLHWNTKYLEKKEVRSNSEEIHHKQADASIAISMGSSWKLLYEVGSYETTFPVSEFASKNGDHKSYGLQYSPNDRFDLSVLTGNEKKSVLLKALPTKRSSLRLAWEDRPSGLRYGVKTFAEFKLKLRHATWNLKFKDEVTSDQEKIFSTDQNNNQTFTFSDSIFREKSISLRAERHMRITTTALEFFRNKREFEQIAGFKSKDVAGAELNASFKVTGRSSLYTRLRSEFAKDIEEVYAGRLDYVQVGLKLKERKHISGSLNYRYVYEDDPLKDGVSYFFNYAWIAVAYSI